MIFNAMLLKEMVRSHDEGLSHRYPAFRIYPYQRGSIVKQLTALSSEFGCRG